MLPKCNCIASESFSELDDPKWADLMLRDREVISNGEMLSGRVPDRSTYYVITVEFNVRYGTSILQRNKYTRGSALIVSSSPGGINA